jgi:hypothetical protein
MTSARWAPKLQGFARSYAHLIAPCLIGGLLYLGLLNAPFLSWDDDKNIPLNPYYLHTGWWRLWLEPYFGVYVPVVSTIWAALFKVGSGSAEPFRVFNAVAHALNTALVGLLLNNWFARRSLNGLSTRFAIGLGAAIFALHPLQTATVAWISGGRDLTATAFGLGAILVVHKDGRRYFVIATALFALGLLSKPSIAGIPLALVAHDALLERSRFGQTLRRMAVWAALVTAVAIGTNSMQSEMATVSVSVLRRPLVALDAAGFYILKVLWPMPLSGDYGRTPAQLFEHRALLIPTLVALAVAGLGMWRVRKAPAIQVWGWLGFLAILPVLGLVTFAFQRISTVADHYMYLPMVAVSGAAAVGVNRLGPRLAASAFAGLVILMAAGSWQRLEVWRSSDAYFRDVLAKNPNSFSALTNLSQIACARGELDWGLQLTERSLAVAPSEAATLANKAYCLFHAQRFAEVVGMVPQLRVPDINFSLEHNDGAASSLANTIAGAYFATGDPSRGALFLCQAQATAPYDEAIRENLAEVTKELAGRGIEVRCPARMQWRDLLAAR